MNNLVVGSHADGEVCTNIGLILAAENLSVSVLLNSK